jgi:cyclic pyranopterin phosphate synthase
MYDSFNRHINYLRISVTDRCNLRCSYCMPTEGVPLIRHNDILGYEEIIEVVNEAILLGIDKVRVTGGEPLVRKGITGLMSMLAAIPAIRDLSMTTNGQLLETFAPSLKEAGLHRVNISLDTMDESRYREMTRGGDLSKVLKGIGAAITAGLHPVKINCVIEKSPEEADAKAVAEFGKNLGIQVRFIRQMDLANGEFYTVAGGSGGDCSRCNRLRLTANGMVKPCLFDDREYSVRELGARKALLMALENKPACGTVNSTGRFYSIGG